MGEVLRGLGRSPSGFAVIGRVFLVPALVAALVAVLGNVANPLLVGFVVGAGGNALVVWHGFFDPPPTVYSHPGASAYRLALAGFVSLAGLSGLVACGVASLVRMQMLGHFDLRGLAIAAGVTIAFGILINVASFPLVNWIYRKRSQ
jgi:hypothetical protein